jgi:hypothetical protein
MNQHAPLPAGLEEMIPEDHLERVENRVMDELDLEPVQNENKGMKKVKTGCGLPCNSRITAKLAVQKPPVFFMLKYILSSFLLFRAVYHSFLDSPLKILAISALQELFQGTFTDTVGIPKFLSFQAAISDCCQHIFL